MIQRTFPSWDGNDCYSGTVWLGGLLLLTIVIRGLSIHLFSHDELCVGKKFAHSMCSQLICISNSSQGSTPLGGMRCSLNIPGHPIIASKNVIMLPSNEMEKTATSDDYNSNHFQDATLLCSLIFQKQESREMSHTNLTGLIRKNLKGGTLSLFSL